jgi:hypothetical protein
VYAPVDTNPALLTKLVPVAAPRIGVTKVGVFVNATTVPVPLVEYDVPHAVPVEFAIPAPG